jgi:triacylglycerol lipase
VPSRRRLRIWALGLIPLLAIAAAAGVIFIRQRDGGISSVDQTQQGPVLLVAGYGGGTGALETLAAALRGQGRTPVIVPATGDNTGDVEVQAQNLQKVAQQQMAAGAPSVDVVGHSLGGVVARVWANEYGRNVARRIVTLGSPHHGTDYAAVAAGLASDACPVACQQVIPGSPLLASLPETPGGARWVSIYTANDQTVIPVSTSILKGAVNIELQDVCSGAQVSHGGLLQDPLAIGLVETALAGPPLKTAPGPDQCAILRAEG